MCKDFSWNVTYGSGRILHITGELAFLIFFENNSRLQASLEQACTTLFSVSKLTTTQTWIKHMQPTELLGSLAKRLHSQQS